MIRVSEEALRVARLKGSVLAHANASHALATARYRAGRLSEAVADATAACDAGPLRLGALPALRARDPGRGPARPGRGRCRRDRRSTCRTPSSAGAPRARTSTSSPAGRGSRFALGRAAGCARRVPRVRSASRARGERATRRSTRGVPARRSRRCGSGSATRPAGSPPTELADARAWGAPRPIGLALRTQGLIEGGDAGIELLREAVAELERSPSPVEQARALIDLGAALRRSGRRQDARGPLRQRARPGPALRGPRAHEPRPGRAARRRRAAAPA